MADASDEVLRAVRSHLEAFNADDLERLMGGFAEDAVFATGEHLFVGVRGIRAMFAEALGGIDATLELRTAVVQGDVAACELTEHIDVGGVVHEFHLAAFYTVRQGRIARAKIYREGTAEPPT